MGKVEQIIMEAHNEAALIDFLHEGAMKGPPIKASAARCLKELMPALLRWIEAERERQTAPTDALMATTDIAISVIFTISDQRRQQFRRSSRPRGHSQGRARRAVRRGVRQAAGRQGALMIAAIFRAALPFLVCGGLILFAHRLLRQTFLRSEARRVWRQYEREEARRVEARRYIATDARHRRRA